MMTYIIISAAFSFGAIAGFFVAGLMVAGRGN
jgi:hypothetical protein